MRTIGLLGGMSWESSLLYEQIMNQQVRARLGGVHSADLLVRSYDFAVVEALQAADDWDAAGRLLAGDAAALVAAGADAVVLCTNTMHQVADVIEAAIDVPLLHIADPVVHAANTAGVRSLALLGTRFTMEQPFLRDRLEAAGLRVLVPDATGRQLVHDVIYGELVRGVVSPESRRAVLDVVEALAERGATGVVSGCTEIELLIGADDVGVAFLPTTRLHALAAVDFALGQ
ncbi:MAG: amino acid racemase [Jiangellales bacterium]